MEKLQILTTVIFVITVFFVIIRKIDTSFNVVQVVLNQTQFKTNINLGNLGDFTGPGRILMQTANAPLKVGCKLPFKKLKLAANFSAFINKPRAFGENKAKSGISRDSGKNE